MEIRIVGLRELEAFYRKIEQRLAPKSIRAVRNVLRQSFDYAKRARYITHNPRSTSVDCPRSTRGKSKRRQWRR